MWSPSRQGLWSAAWRTPRGSGAPAGCTAGPRKLGTSSVTAATARASSPASGPSDRGAELSQGIAVLATAGRAREAEARGREAAAAVAVAHGTGGRSAGAAGTFTGMRHRGSMACCLRKASTMIRQQKTPTRATGRTWSTVGNCRSMSVISKLSTTSICMQHRETVG